MAYYPKDPRGDRAKRLFLAVTEDGGVHSITEIRAALAEHWHLTARQLNRKPVGRHVAWFQTTVEHDAKMLSTLGLIRRATRDHYRITEAGRHVLAEMPDELGDIPRVLKVLKEFERQKRTAPRRRTLASLRRKVASHVVSRPKSCARFGDETRDAAQSAAHASGWSTTT